MKLSWEVSLAGMLQDMVLKRIDVEEFLTNLAKLAAERFSSRGTEVLGAVTREYRTYAVTDFRTETRFGEYTHAIAGHGLLSALGIPIPLEAGAQAGLNLYAPTADYFTAQDIAEAEALAREASKSLRMAVRIATLTDTSEHLKTAMGSRTVIDAAAGVVMGRNRCSHETARTILKAASSGRNITLSAVASRVVQSLGQEIPRTHFDG